MRRDPEPPVRDRSLRNDVVAEIRGAFVYPWEWLLGVGTNLVLASAWLLFQPLHGHHHQDWVELVGLYFSSWIVADVTTTNLLGADHRRVRRALDGGEPLWRVIIVKNIALIAIVGLPTLVVAMVVTLWLESPGRLLVTIPNVAVPILSWIGVGNLVSVLLPVASVPLAQRWRQRREHSVVAIWLAHLMLPYCLFYVADPVDGVPHKFLWTEVPKAIGPILGRHSRSFVHVGIAVVVWAICTALAQMVVARRGLRFIGATPAP